MTHEEWKREWDALSEAQREFYRHKANWEGMTLMAVMREWPVSAAEARRLLASANGRKEGTPHGE